LPAAITITLTRHDESDSLVRETLERLAALKDVRATILFFDQKGSADLTALCAALSGPDLKFETRSIEKMALSPARNLAIQACRTDHLLYLDADARPRPDWARALSETLDRPAVAIAGSRILPDWESKPLFPTRSAIVREHYSLLDLGEETREVDKVFGAGFGIDCAKLGPEAFFDAALGRTTGTLLGGEEVDLCRRALAAGHTVAYCGTSVVDHFVPAARTTWRWLMRRFYYAGCNRALSKGPPQPVNRLSSANLLPLVPLLPAYAIGYLRGNLGS
jgi:hypothetical protein